MRCDGGRSPERREGDELGRLGERATHMFASVRRRSGHMCVAQVSEVGGVRVLQQVNQAEERNPMAWISVRRFL
jgi:hypothetical protein